MQSARELIKMSSLEQQQQQQQHLIRQRCENNEKKASSNVINCAVVDVAKKLTSSNNNNNNNNVTTIGTLTTNNNSINNVNNYNQNRDIVVECRVPKINNNIKRDRDQLINDNVDNDKSFQACMVADKYLLLDQVEGSLLYRCVDVNTQEELVCKVVSKDSHSLVSAHYRLDSHPRVSSLHEVLIGSRFLYLVFPKAHGDLHSYVRSRKRLRETEARRLFRQIAETVQVCHSNGIVLRDLKLRKFVFADTQRSELKLESLEDAVVLEEPESDWLHDKRGCPAYVSPEILKAGSHYSGKAADMWSLGVILYTMLVGRYPFNDAEHPSLFLKISRGHYVIPECLSSRARCLIRSLLRKEPSERITSEDILHHPWFTREERDWHPRACDQLVPGSSFYDD